MNDTFEALAALRRDPGIGAATKWAYCVLWHAAGGKPGEVIVTTAQMAFELGRSASSARRALAELDRIGLIDVAQHGRRGELVVYVYQPAPPADAAGLAAPAAADPQLRLDFEAPERAKPAPVLEPKPEPRGPSGGERAKPAPKMTPKVEPAPSPAVSRAEPAPKPAGSGGDDGDSLVAMYLSRRAEEPTTHSLSAGAGAGAITNYQEPKKSLTNNQEPTTKNQLSGLRSEGAGPETPIGDVLPAAIRQAIDHGEGPEQLAARLERRILGTVPELQWVTGVNGRPTDGLHAMHLAVRAVVEYGAPESELGIILNDVRAMRNAGTLRRGPAAFFRYKVGRMAARHGCPTRASPAGV